MGLLPNPTIHSTLPFVLSLELYHPAKTEKSCPRGKLEKTSKSVQDRLVQKRFKLIQERKKKRACSFIKVSDSIFFLGNTTYISVFMFLNFPYCLLNLLL